MDIGSILAGVNNKVGGLGNFVINNRIPLMKAADVANIIGGYHRDHGRGFELMKKLWGQEGGPIASNAITGQTPQPAPGQGQAAPTTTPVKEISVKYQDLNANGVPDAQEAAQPSAATDPRMVGSMIAGYPFQQGAGSVAAGSPAPAVQSPAPASAPAQAQAPAQAPMREELTAPFVRSPNEADMGNLGWAFGAGVPTNIATTVMNNAMKLRELNTQLEGHRGSQLSGQASLINALTNAQKAGPEIDKIQSETEENKQNAKKLIEDTKDILARRTGTDAYSPEATRQKKAAEEDAVNTKKIEMQAAELNEFIKRPLALKVIPTDVHKAAGLSPDIKTYADAARLYGPKEAMDKLTDAYVRTKTASISAAGVSSAAANQSRTTVIQTLKTIQDGQLKDRDKSMLMVTKLRDKMNTILMNPQEKAANDVELAFWVKQLEGDMARLGKTESQLQSLLSIEPKPAGPEPKSKFKKDTSPGDKGAEKIKLRVNGKTISATRVGATQARGEDGKLYNIKQK